ncbi:uncharacterized protein LOC142494649 [Ascaphus truei]|uniref:uncharacterized protein LOC142494649 n=1 Tax=Ascaphus truei TaxID=8439 RepID=UPI003F590C55
MPAKRGKSDAGGSGSATRASTRRSERTVQGSDVAGSASGVAGSGSAGAVSGVAGSVSGVAGSGSAVAVSGSVVAGSGSAVAGSGSAVAGSGSAVARSGSAGARSGSAGARSGSAGAVSAAGGAVADGVDGGGVLAGGQLLEALPLEEGESSQHQPSSDPKPARKKRVEKPRNPRFNDQENTALVTGILEHYDSIYGHLLGRTSSASRKEMWDTIVIGVNACGNHVRDKRNCHKRFDDIRSKLKKKIQHQRVHATGTGGGPTPQRLILSPLEELLRAKLLPVVVEGLPGDRDIGIYPSQFPPVAPEGHVSPETEQVSSPGSASSTHLEEHDEEDFDDDDDDDDDAAAAAIDTQIQASDHEEVPIETVLPPKRPANTTYDAIVASEGKIVEAENRRHSDLMTVLERMIALQEETVSQLAHLHRVFIEVPKQLQKINTSFEALVVQQTQANYWRMTNVPQFNTSQPGSVHAGQFSPHSSDIHSPGPNVTGQVAGSCAGS